MWTTLGTYLPMFSQEGMDDIIIFCMQRLESE